MTRAKDRILRVFSEEGLGPEGPLAADELASLLLGVEERIPFGKPRQNAALCRFLYAGCLRHDRWLKPTPYIVSPQLHPMYLRFLKALERAEGGPSENTPGLHLRRLRTELAELAHLQPFQEIDRSQLTTMRSEMERLKQPQSDSKRREFIAAQEVLLGLLEGIEQEDLTTVVHTSIPYAIHLQPLQVSFSWDGIPVECDLVPSFSSLQESFAEIAPNAQPVGPSRWQSATTAIQCVFHCLVDFDREVDPLLVITNPEPSHPGWDAGTDIVFKVIDALSWQIRLEHGGEAQWSPAPRDIPFLEWNMRTPRKDRLIWKWKASPGVLLKAFGKPGPAKQIALGDLPRPPWHLKCAEVARSYSRIGETNEALFWLNVGTESLIADRLEEIARRQGTGFAQDLVGRKAYWGEAEEVIREQAPELLGKIRWPETGAHVSLYRKLKYLFRKVKMKRCLKETLSAYNAVSRKRNALFHGSTERRLGVDALVEATKGYEWLREHFQAEEDNHTP